MRLVISKLAREDLVSIEEYTRENWGEQQSDLYLAQIEHSILSLLETPYIGATRPDVADGYRCLPEGRHLIFYRIDGDVVKILGVPHASMDLNRHLESK